MDPRRLPKASPHSAARIDADDDAAGELDLDPMSDMPEKDQLKSAHSYDGCRRSARIAKTS